jgi:hypothetical protein
VASSKVVSLEERDEEVGGLMGGWP